MDSLQVYFVVFNANNTKIEDFGNLLPQFAPGLPDNDFDMFVISVQNFQGGQAIIRDWRMRLEVYFDQSGRNIKYLVQECEGSSATVVYAKAAVVSETSKVEVVHKSVCIADANESIHSALHIVLTFEGTTIAFVNMNVPTPMFKSEIRNLNKCINDNLCGGDDYSASADAVFVMLSPKTLIPTKSGKAALLLKKKKHKQLLEMDPFYKILGMKDESFCGFKEQEITFMPTTRYKEKNSLLLGYFDRCLYRHSLACDIEPIDIHTRHGVLQYVF